MSEFLEVVGAKQEPLRCFGMGHFCRLDRWNYLKVLGPREFGETHGQDCLILPQLTTVMV
jgi:hypothetical protein